MTVQELIGLLEDCNPEAEVKLAIQRHYPLEGDVLGVASSEMVREVQLEGMDDGAVDLGELVDEGKVYIAIKTADEYSDADIWEAVENDNGRREAG